MGTWFSPLSPGLVLEISLLPWYHWPVAWRSALGVLCPLGCGAPRPPPAQRPQPPSVGNQNHLQRDMGFPGGSELLGGDLGWAERLPRLRTFCSLP